MYSMWLLKFWVDGMDVCWSCFFDLIMRCCYCIIPVRGDGWDTLGWGGAFMIPCLLE